MTDTTFIPDLPTLQARLQGGPFNAWLGLRLISGGNGHAEIEMPWQESFVSTPERRATHGGVLASLIDVAAIYALICTTGRLYATVDLRIDYHALPAPGLFRAAGSTIRIGRTLSTSEARIFDMNGRLVASGRGAFTGLDIAV